MRRRHIYAAALLVGAVACVSNSDRALVKRASASYVYAHDRYEQICVEPDHPQNVGANCLQIKSELDAWYKDLNAQLDAATVGPLPAEARARLKVYAKVKIW